MGFPVGFHSVTYPGVSASQACVTTRRGNHSHSPIATAQLLFENWAAKKLQ